MNAVPVFPLPETVLFPRVDIALHLFEPRYRQMGEDVIGGSGYLVMALLRPGYERNYEGDPEMHEIATLARVLNHDKLEDGRYDIVLRGERRIRMLPAPGGIEHPGERLYRVRPVEPAPERALDDDVRATELSDRLRSLWSDIERTSGQDRTDRSQDARDFEDIVNQICARSDVSADCKQELLEEDDLEQRALRLADLLDERLQFWRRLAHYRRFKPEDPSVN